MFNYNLWKLEKIRQKKREREKEQKVKKHLEEMRKISFLSIKKSEQKNANSSNSNNQSETSSMHRVRDLFNLENSTLYESYYKGTSKYDWFISRNSLNFIDILSKNQHNCNKNETSNKRLENIYKEQLNNNNIKGKPGIMALSFEKHKLEKSNRNNDLKKIQKSLSKKEFIGNARLIPSLKKKFTQNSTFDEDDKEKGIITKSQNKTEKDTELFSMKKILSKGNRSNSNYFYSLPMVIFKPILNGSTSRESQIVQQGDDPKENEHKVCYQFQFCYLKEKYKKPKFINFLKKQQSYSQRLENLAKYIKSLSPKLKQHSLDKTQSLAYKTRAQSNWASMKDENSIKSPEVVIRQKVVPTIQEKIIPSILQRIDSNNSNYNLQIKPQGLNSPPKSINKSAPQINMYLGDEKLGELFQSKMRPIIKNKLSSIEVTFHYNISGNYKHQFFKYFAHRVNWKHVTKEDGKDYNFQWKYSPCKLDYKKYKYDPKTPQELLQTINVFEKFNQIGNKNFLFLHMFNFCNENRINLFDLIPMTAIIANGVKFESSLKALEELMSLFENNAKPKESEPIEGICLNTLYKDVFDFERSFVKGDQINIYLPYSYISTKNYWIIKPVDLYQGKCIHITNDIFEIKKFCISLFKGIDKQCKVDNTLNKSNESNPNRPKAVSTSTLVNWVTNNNSNSNDDQAKKKRSTRYCTTSVVIQKYLDHPLLYNKRKFDIRCYVLVDTNLNVFYFREGHLKGCSEEYDMNDLNHFVHITNYSLQKYSLNFEKYEKGNEMSYQSFKDLLLSEGNPPSVFDYIIKKIKLLINISMKSVGEKFVKMPNVLSFQIFGYDFIVDRNFHPWILEVNDNPGLSISSPVIGKIIPRMMDDAFRLTIDKIFETKYSDECIDKDSQEYKSRFHLDGYRDNENVFEFICNLKKESQ